MTDAIFVLVGSMAVFLLIIDGVLSILSWLVDQVLDAISRFTKSASGEDSD